MSENKFPEDEHARRMMIQHALRKASSHIIVGEVRDTTVSDSLR